MTETERRTNEIVIAQDGSPAAMAAAGIAIQIAQRLELTAYGLYVVDEALALDPYAEYQQELMGEREPSSRTELLTWFEEQGDAALRQVESRCRAAGVPVRAGLLAGGVAEIILRESQGARLLAMGRRGRGHEGDAHHLGRSFRSIAHHGHLPMLIGGNEERAVGRLLLAYNGRDSARRALAWASLLQRRLPAGAAAVAVQEKAMPSTSEWLAEAQAQLVDCTCLHLHGEPAEGIIAAAGASHADLIVMGHYGHGPALEWLVDSTVDRVLRSTQLPVLMV